VHPRILVAGCVFQLRSRAAEFLESRDRGVQVGLVETSQRFTMSPSSVNDVDAPPLGVEAFLRNAMRAAWV